jgi:hypothetical protein
MKRKTTIIATLLFLITGAAFSQDKLFLANSDTLNGKITILFPEEYYEEILFETDDDKKRLKAYEFKGFSKDDEIYRTIKSGEIYRIMKLEKEGYLSLYSYRMDKAYSFGGMYLFRRDGIGRDVPTMRFKKTMMAFLDDCNSIQPALEEGKYKKKNVEQLIEDYNLCITSKTEEQYAEGKQKPLKTVSDDPVLLTATEILNKAKQLGDDELQSMLNDVIEKLQEGERIPSYLKNALEEYAGEEHALNSDIMSLLANL